MDERYGTVAVPAQEPRAPASHGRKLAVGLLAVCGMVAAAYGYAGRIHPNMPFVRARPTAAVNAADSAFGYTRANPSMPFTRTNPAGAVEPPARRAAEALAEQANATNAFNETAACNQRCNTGTVPVDGCKACACAEGYGDLVTEDAGLANETSTCSACPAGKYDDIHSDRCKGCTVCGWRTELLAQCALATDTKCGCVGQEHDMKGAVKPGDDFETKTCTPKPCVDGVSFAATPDYPDNACSPCSSCGAGTEQVSACSIYADTVCQCAAGKGGLKAKKVLKGHNWHDEMRCTACVAGVTFSAAPGGKCTPCTVCGAGTAMQSDCAPSDDRQCRCKTPGMGLPSVSFFPGAGGDGAHHDHLRPKLGLLPARRATAAGMVPTAVCGTPKPGSDGVAVPTV